MANNKRKQGEGTLRQRADGRWEGRIVIGYNENGDPKTKSVTAKTKFECEEKLKALKETLGRVAENVCVCVCVLSCAVMSNSVIPWTVAHQAPMSMEILQARILGWVVIS